jgi:hypothetical protein
MALLARVADERAPASILASLLRAALSQSANTNGVRNVSPAPGSESGLCEPIWWWA